MDVARPAHPSARALLAAGLLVLTCAAALLDATVDGARWSSGPLGVLVPVAAAVLVGAWCRPALAVVATFVGAATLTAANQVASPASYSPANDLTFFTLVLAGPVAVGAVWAARRDQAGQLRALARRLTAQRAAEVRLARLEEQNRLAADVQRGLAERMGAIAVQAAGAAAADDADTDRALVAIESSARDALSELRDHVGLLREPEPADPARPARPPDEALPAPPIDAGDVLAGAWGIAMAVELVTSGSSRGPVLANVLLGLCVCAPLVLRRRRPLTAVVLVTLVGAAGSAVLTPLPATVTSFVPLLLLAYAVGGYLPWPRVLLGVVLLMAGVGLDAWVSPSSARDLDGVAPTLLWLALAFGAGLAGRAQRRRLARLRHDTDELERGREQERLLAVAEERRRVAADLHDSVAHAMTVVCLHAAAARTDGSSPAEALAVIADTARAGVAELRTGLRDADAEPMLTLPAVIASARAAGLHVQAVGDLVPDLAPATDDLAARVVREALVNASRHAPGSEVVLRCTVEDTVLRLEVVDHGAATSVATEPFPFGSGQGLRMLDDRVRSAAGSLSHGPVSPRGYRVVLELPVVRVVPA